MLESGKIVVEGGSWFPTPPPNNFIPARPVPTQLTVGLSGRSPLAIGAAESSVLLK